MQNSHTTGMTVYRQHYDRDDSYPLPPRQQAASGLNQLEGMEVPGRSRTASAGVWQQSEIRATASGTHVHIDNCHCDNDRDDAPGGEPEGYGSYYPLTLSGPPAAGGRHQKPRRSFSEPDLLAATCESSFRDDVRNKMQPPEVRRCETFTRHMLRQLEHQASASETDPDSDSESSDHLLLLAVVPASSFEKRVQMKPDGQPEPGGSYIRRQRKKKTLTPGSSLYVKQQQKRRPSVGSGCHQCVSVTGRHYGPHLLHHDAATGTAISEAATSGCELDASLKINAGSCALRCSEAATMIGSCRQGPEGCSLQVNAATRTTCGQDEVRKASGRSLADVVALWEEFLSATFN